MILCPLLGSILSFLWVYPLNSKEEVFSTFHLFFKYVETHFKTKIQSLQCDNGTEYNNSKFHNFFAEQGINFRFSCPYTSQQNGRSERMIRTINNSVRTLLFQAKLPSTYWVEALNASVHILNLLPSKAINNQIPYSVLFKKPVSYSHLRVFGCLCYPNKNHANLSKLSPRSSRCIFLGYPHFHRGYRCLDLESKKIIISRNVTFDETCFPYQDSTLISETEYDFLNADMDVSPIFKSILTAPAVTPTSPAAPSSSNQSTQTVPAVPEAPRHSMTTRSMHGIHKPKQIISLLSHT